VALEIAFADSAVACRARAGKVTPEDFDAIVSLHQRRIYRVLLSLLRDSDAADTLTQECFLRAYQNRADFRGECSWQTWLLRIAMNLARDYRKNQRLAFWRRLVRAETARPDIVDPRSSPERVLLAREEVAAVWSVLDLLPQQQRRVFVLRFGEELDIVQIAEILQVETGTVKSHLARALETLRRRFQR
jgi:RNA polymerase sigma-70 factor (ECF subfamily)